ncbi:MAG: hypothetical protein WC661_04305 [Opitutaceae bacterium]
MNAIFQKIRLLLVFISLSSLSGWAQIDVKTYAKELNGLKGKLAYNPDDCFAVLRSLKANNRDAKQWTADQLKEIARKELEVLVISISDMYLKTDWSFDFDAPQNLTVISVQAPADYDGRDLKSIKNENERLSYVAAVKANAEKAQIRSRVRTMRDDYKSMYQAYARYMKDLVARGGLGMEELVDFLKSHKAPPQLIDAIVKGWVDPRASK